MRCKTCRANASSCGWCPHDHVGMVGMLAILDREAYERTVHALSIVKIAEESASRCKYCAAAIVTDTTCPICKIAYKDGHRIAG